MGKRHLLDAALPDSFDSNFSTFSDAELMRPDVLIRDVQESRLRSQTSAADDELVSFLAVATENLRAQQVYEWERLRRASAAR